VEQPIVQENPETVNKTYSRTEENIDSHVNTAYDNIVNNETNVQTALISQAVLT
jgi:hypothetical protein